jgi:hypothetical protein
MTSPNSPVKGALIVGAGISEPFIRRPIDAGAYAFGKRAQRTD